VGLGQGRKWARERGFLLAAKCRGGGGFIWFCCLSVGERERERSRAATIMPRLFGVEKSFKRLRAVELQGCCAIGWQRQMENKRREERGHWGKQGETGGSSTLDSGQLL